MTYDPSLLRISNLDNIHDLERQKRLPCVLPPEVEAAILLTKRLDPSRLLASFRTPSPNFAR
jgi:hypothetical protein